MERLGEAALAVMARRHCEVLAVVVRGGPQYREPGDPFAWSCVILRTLDMRSGYVLAMIGAPSVADFRRVRSELLALGFERLLFRRVNGREGEFDLRDAREKDAGSAATEPAPATNRGDAP